MMRIGGLMIMLLFVAQGRPAPGKINSTFDKTAAFATFKTYGWIAGQPAFDPAVNKTPTESWGDFHNGVASGYYQSENPGGARYWPSPANGR